MANGATAGTRLPAHLVDLRKRVIAAKAEYTTAKEEAKERKDEYEKVRETFDQAFDRYESGAEELPFEGDGLPKDHQSDVKQDPEAEARIHAADKDESAGDDADDDATKDITDEL